MTRMLYEQEVRQHLLALREALVRHDENLKAYRLLTEAVPYFLRSDPDIVQARKDQERMVAHVLPGGAVDYADYYATNVHERPFEEQYGIPVSEADRIGRVAWLLGALIAAGGPYEGSMQPTPGTLLDLGCNDGWMLRFLFGRGAIRGGWGVDLNPDCIERARKRFPVLGFRFHCRPVETARSIPHRPQFDAVSCFEVLEHVYDPAMVLKAACDCVRPGHPIYFTTPHGAVEQGEIPNWDHVEPKGHVRAVLPEDITAWVSDVDGLDINTLSFGSDGEGLILCSVRRKAT